MSWFNVLLGIWLAVSPFVLGYSEGEGHRRPRRVELVGEPVRSRAPATDRGVRMKRPLPPVALPEPGAVLL